MYISIGRNHLPKTVIFFFFFLGGGHPISYYLDSCQHCSKSKAVHSTFPEAGSMAQDHPPPPIHTLRNKLPSHLAMQPLGPFVGKGWGWRLQLQCQAAKVQNKGLGSGLPTWLYDSRTHPVWAQSHWWPQISRMLLRSQGSEVSSWGGLTGCI